MRSREERFLIPVFNLGGVILGVWGCVVGCTWLVLLLVRGLCVVLWEICSSPLSGRMLEAKLRRWRITSSRLRLVLEMRGLCARVVSHNPMNKPWNDESSIRLLVRGCTVGCANPAVKRLCGRMFQTFACVGVVRRLYAVFF